METTSAFRVRAARAREPARRGTVLLERPGVDPGLGRGVCWGTLFVFAMGLLVAAVLG